MLPVDKILSSVGGRLLVTFCFLSLPACTTGAPDLDCKVFPSFQSDNTSSYDAAIEKRREMLREAEELRHPLPPTQELIEGYLSIGDRVTAETLAMSMPPSHSRDVSYSSIAAHASSFGDVAGARRAAESIAQDNWRQSAMFHVSMAYARNGDIAAAREIYFPLLSVHGKIGSVSRESAEIAKALAQGGFFELALQVAEEIGPEGKARKVDALISIALAQRDAAKVAESQATLELARQEFNMLLRNRSRYLSLELAEALHAFGLDEQAAQVLAVLRDDLSRQRGLSRYFLRRAFRLHDALGDRAATDELEDIVLKDIERAPYSSLGVSVFYMTDLYARLARSGRLARAQSIAPSSSPRVERLRAVQLAANAGAQASIGQYQSAHGLAEGITDDGGRCSAQVQIVEQMVRRGDLPNAMASAERIDNDSCYRIRGIMGIPSSQPEFVERDPFWQIAVGASYTGDRETACRALGRISSQLAWKDAIREISAVRAAQNDFDGARSVARLASFDSSFAAHVLVQAVTLRPPAWEP